MKRVAALWPRYDKEQSLVHVSDETESEHVATLQEQWARVYKPYNEALG